MRTMTDHRIDGRHQATKKASGRMIDKAAVCCETRLDAADMQKNMATPEGAQNGTQSVKHRRNRTIGRKAVLRFKINERLMRLNADRLQIILLYADAHRAAQAIQRLKKLTLKKGAVSSK